MKYYNIILILFTFLITACDPDGVSRSSYDSKVAQIQALKASNEDLQTKFSAKNIELKEIQTQLKAERNRNKKIKEESLKNDEIRQQLTDLTTKNTNLTTANDELKSENQKFLNYLNQDIFWKIEHLQNSDRVFIIFCLFVCLVGMYFLYLFMSTKLLIKSGFNSLQELKTIKSKAKYHQDDLTALIADKKRLNKEIEALAKYQSVNPAIETKNLINQAEEKARQIIDDAEFQCKQLNDEIKKLEEKIKILQEIEGNF